MNILYGMTCVIGIIFMLTFTFIGIWLFVVALQAFRQLKYQNYILHKIYKKLDSLSSMGFNDDCSEDFDLSELDFIDEEPPNYENVKAFDKKQK